jgi:hypothetical protein
MTLSSKQPQRKPIPQTDTSPAWYASPSRLASLATQMAPISLDDMESAALLDRVDTKFVLTSRQLLEVLSTLGAEYSILEVEGQRLNHYRTLYFDTPTFDLYRQHVNGRADRYKVRSREYTDTRTCFLEVKHKTSKGRTIKSRLATDEPVVDLCGAEQAWLAESMPFYFAQWEPKLWNTFTRLTLVSQQRCERVTLDVDLTFYASSQMLRLDGMAIAEVKKDSHACDSPFLQAMRAARIHSTGFSKYIIGSALLYQQTKKNTVKPQLLRIEKMTGGFEYHD